MSVISQWSWKKNHIGSLAEYSPGRGGGKWRGPQGTPDTLVFAPKHPLKLPISFCPLSCFNLKALFSQFSSVSQLCLTLQPHGLQHSRLPCPSPTPRASKTHVTPRASKTHVHWVGDAIHLILLFPSPPAFNLSQNQGLFQWVVGIRWSKLWSFTSAQSFHWVFRVDFLYYWLVWSPCYPSDSQVSSPAPQFESINSWALNLIYDPTVTSIHDY